MSSYLFNDVGGESIQAMPLRNGFVNLENPSVVNHPKIIYCVTDGNITITWNDTTESTIALIEGNSFTIEGASSLLVEAGTKIHAVGKSVS